MSAPAVAAARPTGLPTRSFAGAALWLGIFLGGFVFIEPAPYDLYLAAVIPLWIILGLPVPRAVSPLIILMILFLTGGLVAATQAKQLDAQPLYVAVSGFLALSACFFACVTGNDPSKMRVVVNAWIAGALATAILGVAGYFGFTGELFVRYGRATGGFQDPNVFGPFLIFPFLALMRRALTLPLRAGAMNGCLALVLFAGIFLSFSRASWGLTILCALLMGCVMLVLERSPIVRARFIGIATAGVVAAAALVAAALSVPTVAELFEERAQVVQEYDSGHMGRFERHAAGFNLMLDHPLGIGAKEFAEVFGEDEHDIWLKALTTYGWLGFTAFLILVLWTLCAAFPLLFRGGALQDVTQIAYIVFAGHIVMATIIDIDHWRHLFLLFGMLWGAIAIDKSVRQERLATALAFAEPQSPPYRSGQPALPA